MEKYSITTTTVSPKTSGHCVEQNCPFLNYPLPLLVRSHPKPITLSGVIHSEAIIDDIIRKMWR